MGDAPLPWGPPSDYTDTVERRGSGGPVEGVRVPARGGEGNPVHA